MPLQATSGAASYDAFGGGVPITPVYVEDVMSTYLYTGNTSTQTITNGIDLSTKGGLVWIKSRDTTFDHMLFDTTRGASKYLNSNATTAESTNIYQLSSFNTNGFSLGDGNFTNNSAYNYVSWTFRKQPKFFDVVTYTGDGSAPRNISHSLNSSPGFIVIKRTNSTGDWWAWHRSIANKNIYLNYTDAADSGTNPMISAVSSTNFTLATNQNATMNINGATYVAYIFAHDAGGFGLSGTDNVISCGSFTTDGSGNASVNLGYEPQWVLIKRSDSTGNWLLMDSMRGMPVTANSSTTTGGRLYPNRSDADDGFPSVIANATGFITVSGTVAASATYIYIAIRRGPMRVPTSGTSVYNAVARTGTGSAANITTAGFTPDLLIGRSRLATTSTPVFVDRLRGNTKFLQSAVTDAEGTSGSGSDVTGFLMNGFSLGSPGGTDLNTSSASEIYYPLKRAPSFMDEVCYTGTGAVGNAVSHNLGVAPELMIIKGRSGTIGTNDWQVLSKITASDYVKLVLNATSAELGPFTYAVNAGLAAQPTSTTFTVNNTANFNNGSTTYVAYLFATCAGVSKVGSYTGTGTTQTINCGFTAGARFVLIKRTDSTGDWYVWDSARGIVSGNDPYILLNSTAAEVTSTDYIDTYSAGFEISSTAPAAINASGGTFIFLAIA